MTVRRANEAERDEMARAVMGREDFALSPVR
jgi:hypothetical protein